MFVHKFLHRQCTMNIAFGSNIEASNMVFSNLSCQTIACSMASLKKFMNQYSPSTSPPKKLKNGRIIYILLLTLKTTKHDKFTTAVSNKQKKQGYRAKYIFGVTNITVGSEIGCSEKRWE